MWKVRVAALRLDNRHTYHDEKPFSPSSPHDQAVRRSQSGISSSREKRPQVRRLPPIFPFAAISARLTEMILIRRVPRPIQRTHGKRR